MLQIKLRSYRLTKVKICGLSTRESVQQSVESGADYIGFVFASSKRQVSLEKAHKLVKGLPDSVQVVGVFVSPTMDQLREAVRMVPLDLIQVHGDFDDNFFDQLEVPAIRALQITSETQSIDSKADFLLFDAPLAGSGQTFDWELLKNKKISKPFFIAGGLTTENVVEATDFFHPYALDVSSGVETDGHKDLEKISRFIESVKK